MKIAFPTMDGQSISAHFGRSLGFLVLETQGCIVQSREVRDNRQVSPGHDHPASGGHDHGAFARLLQDCQVVVVRGMGMGAVQAIQGAGIRVCRVEEGCTPEEAVKRLASDGLADLREGTCGCSHTH